MSKVGTAAASLTGVTYQSIGGNEYTSPEFVSADDWDSDDATADANDNSITIEKDGLYLLSASLAFTDFSVDHRVILSFVQDQFVVTRQPKILSLDNNNYSETSKYLQKLDFLEGGKTYSLKVENTESSNVDINSTYGDCYFAVARLDGNNGAAGLVRRRIG